MRRLRPEDGTRAHRRAARYHATKCTQVKNPVHAELATQMGGLLQELRLSVHKTEDADDLLVEKGAVADAAEIAIEDEIRNLDSELERLDRLDPGLGAQKTVLPHGYTEIIDPEGAEQLKVLPGLKLKLAPFLGMGTVNSIVKQLDINAAAFDQALKDETAAEEAYDLAFAEEVNTRRKIREQLEDAYGKLRSFYKARPATAERFFLKEGSARTPAKEPKKDG